MTPLPDVRWRAVYSLARLRAPGAANHLIAALRADDADTRAVAARALTRQYARAPRSPRQPWPDCWSGPSMTLIPGFGSMRSARWARSRIQRSPRQWPRNWRTPIPMSGCRRRLASAEPRRSGGRSGPRGGCWRASQALRFSVRRSSRSRGRIAPASPRPCGAVACQPGLARARRRRRRMVSSPEHRHAMVPV